MQDMQEAQLAMVPSTASLPQVLEHMQKSGHAAVIVRRDHGFTWVSADQVLRTLRSKQNAQTVGDIESMERPALLPRSDEAAGWTGRLGVRRGLLAALGTGEGKYAILDVNEDRATVATSAKRLADAFNYRLTLCRCTLHPETHVWQQSELRQSGKCNLDGAPVNCG